MYNQQRVAVAGLQSEGGGALTIRDRVGTLVAYLDVEDWGARLQRRDSDGEGGVVLFGGDSGDGNGGGIHILSRSEVGPIALWAGPEGGSLTIYGPDSSATATTLWHDAAGGHLSLTDATGAVIFTIPAEQ